MTMIIEPNFMRWALYVQDYVQDNTFDGALYQWHWVKVATYGIVEFNNTAAQQEEVADFLLTALTGRYTFSRTDLRHFYFESPKDAAVFKLRFG